VTTRSAAHIGSLLLVASACAGSPPPAADAPRASTRGGDPSVAPGSTDATWAAVTQSPWPPAQTDEREASLTSSCGAPDAALSRVARQLVDAKARSDALRDTRSGEIEPKGSASALDPDAVAALLRFHGEPHLRPRLVVARGPAPIDGERLRAELESVRRPETRCGLAVGKGSAGDEIVLAVAVDALADLAPLPTRARTGHWINLEGTLRAPAKGAKVVLLGPRGAPRPVPSSLDPNGRRIRARFALDQPGAFTVQVLADLERGPLPVLEARIFADAEPPSSVEPAPAPGEDAAAGATDAPALGRMIAALRASEGLAPLASDPRLERTARAHAERMRDARSIGHNVGQGDLTGRLDDPSLAPTRIGENVARGASIERAHRALYASPSHRANLLRADYTHIGVGVVKDADGTFYVCEVFATVPR
jgi:uncharacterized protein YkwD